MFTDVPQGRKKCSKISTVYSSWTENSVSMHCVFIPVDGQLYFPSTIFRPSGTENNTEHDIHVKLHVPQQVSKQAIGTESL